MTDAAGHVRGGTRQRRSDPTAPRTSVLPATLTLPIPGFDTVARSVAGSVAAELDLPFERIDDLQLAVEVILRSKVLRGPAATISFAVEDRDLVVTIEGLEGVAGDRLSRPVVDGMVLGDTLARLVDAVDVIAEPRPALTLRTALPTPAW